VRRTSSEPIKSSKRLEIFKGESYADDETGLYGQSALFIFGMFCEELKAKSILCSFLMNI